MTRRKITILIRIIEVALAFLTTIPSYTAASGTGTTGAQFLRLGAGARPIAMGGAFTAVADDANGPQYNPAGSAWVRNKEAMASYIDYLEGIKYGYIGYLQPLNANSTLGLAYGYLDSGAIDRTDVAGSAIGTFSSTQSLGILTYARSFGDKFALGTNLKLFQQIIEDEKAGGYAFDLGTQYKVRPQFVLGLAVQNIGPGVTFVKEKDPLPVTIKLGALYMFMEDTLNISGDAKYQPKENSKISENVGAEYWVSRNLALRIGYDTASISDIENFTGVSAGMGFKISGLTLNYAWMPYGILGDTHRISLGFKW